MSELIDRQALKAYVNSLSTHPLNEWDTWGVLAAIDKQPAVAAASPWHRVEEELPPDGTIGRYLAYVFTNDAHWELHIVAWFRNKWLFNCGKVHYWMPIEPPKEDE